MAADYDMSNIHTRVLSPGEIRELKAIFERTQAAYDTTPDKRKATRAVQAETQLALWICLSTCCRIGELLMTKWRHVDLNAATWFVPKDNVKGSRGKQQDQLVFLSDFALEQFQTLHKLSGDTAWCFPARDAEQHVCLKSVSKQIGDRQLRFKSRRDLSNRAKTTPGDCSGRKSNGFLGQPSPTPTVPSVSAVRQPSKGITVGVPALIEGQWVLLTSARRAPG